MIAIDSNRFRYISYLWTYHVLAIRLTAFKMIVQPYYPQLRLFRALLCVRGPNMPMYQNTRQWLTHGGDTFHRKFPIELDDYKSKWGELLMTSTQFKNPADSGELKILLFLQKPLSISTAQVIAHNASP